MISIDAISSGQNDASTTITISHVVGNLNDRLLIVLVANERNAGQTAVSGITYDGVALTKIRHDEVNGSNLNRTELWYLLAPNIGTHDVTVTFASAPDGCGVGCASFSGVKQQAPEANDGSNAIAPTSLTITEASLSDGSLILGNVSGTSSSRTITSAVTQTELFNITNTGQMRTAGAFKILGAAASASLSYTFDLANDCAGSLAIFAPQIYTSLPEQADIVSMDHVSRGLPFVDVVATSDVDAETLDYPSRGLPFYAQLFGTIAPTTIIRTLTTTLMGM